MLTSTMNRFIAEDPIGLYGGINLYAYTLGAPTNYFDPTGEAVQLYTPDIYFDLASIGYDLYRLAADGRKGLKTNLTALEAVLARIIHAGSSRKRANRPGHGREASG